MQGKCSLVKLLFVVWGELSPTPIQADRSFHFHYGLANFKAVRLDLLKVNCAIAKVMLDNARPAAYSNLIGSGEVRRAKAKGIREGSLV